MGGVRRRMVWGMILVAVGATLCVLAQKLPPELDDPTMGTYVRIVGWAVGLASAFSGLSVLLFGTVSVGPLLLIDVVSRPPRFFVGPAFFRVAVEAAWRRGAIRVPATRLWLKVGWMTRTLMGLVLGWWVAYRLWWQSGAAFSVVCGAVSALGRWATSSASARAALATFWAWSRW